MNVTINSITEVDPLNPCGHYIFNLTYNDETMDRIYTIEDFQAEPSLPEEAFLAVCTHEAKKAGVGGMKSIKELKPHFEKKRFEL